MKTVHYTREMARGEEFKSIRIQIACTIAWSVNTPEGYNLDS